MSDLRLPNITATSTEGQLSQVKSYLYQIVPQLNFALKSVERIEKEKGYSSLSASENGSQEKTDEEKAQETFFNVKNLIIKSADIVNAYYEVICQKLSSEYEAISEFGEYKKNTDYLMEQTSENRTEFYESLQEINSKIEGINSEIRKDSFYIKTGWLDDGNTIGGIEIGKASVKDGVETDKAFARFTTDSLVFYDSNGTKVAWMGIEMLNIENVTIKNDLYHGGYVIDSSNGLAYKWVGRSSGS